MPGRAGRNRHRDLLTLTESNLAAHNAAHPRKKQDLPRWNDHVALPDALKTQKKKLRTSSSPEVPVDEGTWLDGLRRWVVGLAKRLPGAGLVWRQEEGEEERDQEGGDAGPAARKRKKGKRWYH